MCDYFPSPLGFSCVQPSPPPFEFKPCAPSLLCQFVFSVSCKCSSNSFHMSLFVYDLDCWSVSLFRLYRFVHLPSCSGFLLLAVFSELNSFDWGTSCIWILQCRCFIISRIWGCSGSRNYLSILHRFKVGSIFGIFIPTYTNNGREWHWMFSLVAQGIDISQLSKYLTWTIALLACTC